MPAPRVLPDAKRKAVSCSVCSYFIPNRAATGLRTKRKRLPCLTGMNYFNTFVSTSAVCASFSLPFGRNANDRRLRRKLVLCSFVFVFEAIFEASRFFTHLFVKFWIIIALFFFCFLFLPSPLPFLRLYDHVCLFLSLLRAVCRFVIWVSPAARK